MKQVFQTKSGVQALDVPVPVPGNKEVLVRVAASVVSTGTETHSLSRMNDPAWKRIAEKRSIIRKVTQKMSRDGVSATLWTIKDRLINPEDYAWLSQLGYSNAGVILSKGIEVKNFNVGDRVACAGSGIAVHSEYVAVPVNLAVRIPNDLTLEEAAFVTLGSIALHGIRRSNVKLGETVVIVGLGLLGLLAVQISKASGLRVIGLDVQRARVNLGKKLGADLAWLASDKDVEAKIQRETSGVGADAVIIYASDQSSGVANLSVRLCRQKGRVVVVGNVGMDVDREIMYRKELDFVISTSYGPGRYDPGYELKGNDYPIEYVRWTENRNMEEVAGLIAHGQVEVKPLLSKVFPIEQASLAYEYLLTASNHAIAVGFSYPDSEVVAESKHVLIHSMITKEKVNVGIIGAGSFVSEIHLPNLLKLNKYFSLVAIANRTPAKARMLGDKFKPHYVTCNYQEVLADKGIDAVIIGTRHDLHAKFILEALQAGKHVFVEKPLALNRRELKKIKDQAIASKTHLTVGFNRRYSEYSIRARDIIQSIGSPAFISYRVNAGLIPASSWVQDPLEGGGRIIGECCHFLDLFNFLLGSEMCNIECKSVPLDDKAIISEDNVAVTVSYSNGSIGVLSYVSIGNTKLPKERIEIFVGNVSVVIDNFECLQIFNNTGIEMIRNKVDKGYLRQMEEWAKCLKGESSIVLTTEDAYAATQATFDIVDQIHG